MNTTKPSAKLANRQVISGEICDFCPRPLYVLLCCALSARLMFTGTQKILPSRSLARDVGRILPINLEEYLPLVTCILQVQYN